MRWLVVALVDAATMTATCAPTVVNDAATGDYCTCYVQGWSCAEPGGAG